MARYWVSVAVALTAIVWLLLPTLTCRERHAPGK